MLIQVESQGKPVKALFNARKPSIVPDDFDSGGEHDTVKNHESSEHPQIPAFLTAVSNIAAKGWYEFDSGGPRRCQPSHFSGVGDGAGAGFGVGVGLPVLARSRR